MSEWIIRHIFDRIPALGSLRGVARMDAEEVLANALQDAIDEYLVDCEVVPLTGGDQE